MPRIFDNIEQRLLPALRETLDVSYRADFCVGYFNLRGWRQIDTRVQAWTGGQGACCRLLVGMQRRPDESLRATYSLRDADEEMDNQTASQLRRRLAEDFRRQLTMGTPSNEDEAGLRRLACQIRDEKLVVKLFLRHPLHAKLYLLYRQDPFTPIIGYMGSSNLTFPGLAGQGELNVDVLEQDAAEKLRRWFEDRWDDHWCTDISAELDAAYFHLYGIARDGVDYIMDTFPIVKRKDEAAHGEYRTKRVILEMYDEMQQAMETGQPYQTRLGPPPADPRAAHLSGGATAPPDRCG